MTYYISETGTGSKTDATNPATPMSVATHNSSTFAAGDIIEVQDDLTSGLIIPSSGASGNRIVYRGAPGASITAAGGDAIRAPGTRNYIEIDGTNLALSGTYGVRVMAGATGWWVHNLTISAGTYAVQFYGASAISATVENITATLSDAAAGYAVYFATGTGRAHADVTISGIASNAGGVFVDSTTNVSIDGVTTTATGSRAVYLNACAGTLAIANVTAAGNEYGVRIDNSTFTDGTITTIDGTGCKYGIYLVHAANLAITDVSLDGSGVDGSQGIVVKGASNHIRFGPEIANAYTLLADFDSLMAKARDGSLSAYLAEQGFPGLADIRYVSGEGHSAVVTYDWGGEAASIEITGYAGNHYVVDGTASYIVLNRAYIHDGSGYGIEHQGACSNVISTSCVVDTCVNDNILTYGTAHNILDYANTSVRSGYNGVDYTDSNHTNAGDSTTDHEDSYNHIICGCVLAYSGLTSIAQVGRTHGVVLDCLCYSSGEDPDKTGTGVRAMIDLYAAYENPYVAGVNWMIRNCIVVEGEPNSVLYGSANVMSRSDMDYMIYYHSAGDANFARLTFDGNAVDFATYQAAGLEPHSQWLDAKLVDPEHWNFSIRPSSPALRRYAAAVAERAAVVSEAAAQSNQIIGTITVAGQEVAGTGAARVHTYGSAWRGIV